MPHQRAIMAAAGIGVAIEGISLSENRPGAIVILSPSTWARHRLTTSKAPREMLSRPAWRREALSDVESMRKPKNIAWSFRRH